MITLFYILGALFFYFEIGILQNSKKYLSRLRLIESLNKEDEGGAKKVDFDSLKQKDNGIVGFIFTGIGYLIWTIIGVLFAGQWIMFLCLLAFGFFVGFYRKRFLKNNTTKNLRLIRFDAFVSSIWLAFIVINHFYHIL